MNRMTGRLRRVDIVSNGPVREIVRTCSNPHIARAAVVSIGGDFARHFSRDAAKRNLPSGIFAAGLVRRFSRQAGVRDWEGVDEATRAAELDEDDADPEWGWPRPSVRWRLAAGQSQNWDDHKKSRGIVSSHWREPASAPFS